MHFNLCLGRICPCKSMWPPVVAFGQVWCSANHLPSIIQLQNNGALMGREKVNLSKGYVIEDSTEIFSRSGWEVDRLKGEGRGAGVIVMCKVILFCRRHTIHINDKICLRINHTESVIRQPQTQCKLASKQDHNNNHYHHRRQQQQLQQQQGKQRPSARGLFQAPALSVIFNDCCPCILSPFHRLRAREQHNW